MNFESVKIIHWKKLQGTNQTGELMESQQQIDQLTAAQEEAMIEWEELAEKV